MTENKHEKLSSESLRSLSERRHFDDLAVSYGDTWWGHRTPAGRVRDRRRAASVMALLGPQPGGRLLEIGSGTGNFTRFALEYVNRGKVVAVDISTGQLRLAQQRVDSSPRGRVCYAVMNVECPAFRPGTFDAVYGSSILHHLDLDTVLPRLRELLRPSGAIAFAEPNLLNPWVFCEKRAPGFKKLLQDSPDETAYTRWALRRSLEQHGFTRIEIIPFDFLHPLVPRPLIPLVLRVGRLLESAPIVREFAGSLMIRAQASG